MSHSVQRAALLVLAFTFLVTAGVAVAQDLHPSRRPSPMGMARVTLDDGTYVSVVYGRPYKRSRENIFGEGDDALVPFGKVWRTGANEATQVTVTGDVTVGGKALPAGTYSLFTTPGAESWTFHFNSMLGMWGEFGPNPETGQFERRYDASKNVVDATAGVGSVDDEVDQLTIAFEEVEDGVHLVLTWINTEVRLPIQSAG